MAGLAHDLNNLLGVIGNYASALARNELLPPSLQTDVSRIATAATSAAALARQMLTSGADIRTERVRVELAALVTPLVAAVAAGLSPGVQLHADLGEGTLVLVEPDALARLVLNVLVNAREALPDEGLITVMTDHAHTPEGAVVQLRVTDTGVGMTPNVLQRVFEPSFSTKIATRQRGFGLAGALGVMERMGGTINLRSEPGQGTIVTFTLPRWVPDPIR